MQAAQGCVLRDSTCCNAGAAAFAAAHARAALRRLPALEGRLQCAVLVLPRALWPHAVARQAPAALVVAATLQSPVQQQAPRLQVGRRGDHLGLALVHNIHLAGGARAGRGARLRAPGRRGTPRCMAWHNLQLVPAAAGCQACARARWRPRARTVMVAPLGSWKRRDTATSARSGAATAATRTARRLPARGRREGRAAVSERGCRAGRAARRSGSHVSASAATQRPRGRQVRRHLRGARGGAGGSGSGARSETGPRCTHTSDQAVDMDHVHQQPRTRGIRLGQG